MVVGDHLQGAGKPTHIIWVCDTDSRTSVCQHHSFHPINRGIITGMVLRPKTSVCFGEVKCGFDGAAAPAIEMQGDAVSSETDFDGFHRLLEAVRAGVDRAFSAVGFESLGFGSRDCVPVASRLADQRQEFRLRDDRNTRLFSLLQLAGSGIRIGGYKVSHLFAEGIGVIVAFGPDQLLEVTLGPG